MNLSSWSSRRGLAATALLGAVLGGRPPALGAQRARPVRRQPAPATALALEIADYASLPMTGSPDGTGNNAGSLARINVMRQEPRPGGRFFVNDLTGPLYILDRRTKNATTYLDFNGRGSRTGLFDKLHDRRRPGERLHQLRVRSGLRAQRTVLHHSSRGNRAAGNADAGQSRASPASMSPAIRPPRRSRRPGPWTTKAC